MFIINPSRFESAGITLGWGTAVGITADSDVSTNGTFTEANTYTNDATNRTVNGVTFTAQGTLSGWNGCTSNADLYQGGLVGAAFESVLDSGAFSLPSTTEDVVIGSLTSGKTYELQIFISDDRESSAARTQSYTLQAYNSASYANGADGPYYLICNFVASGTTETLTVSSGNAEADDKIFNAYQVRQLD